MPTKIVSSRLLCQEFGSLTEYVFQFRRVDGGIETISREVYDRGHAAAVLLHNPQTDQVILVRQFRPAPMVNGEHPYLLEAVAGILDGDSPETCVRREAEEEAGVVVRELQFVTRAYALCAAVTEVLSMYIGTYDSKDRLLGGGLIHEGEDIEVVEISFSEAYALFLKGEIVDMKTILLLQALMIRRSHGAITVEEERTSELCPLCS